MTSLLTENAQPSDLLRGTSCVLATDSLFYLNLEKNYPIFSFTPLPLAPTPVFSSCLATNLLTVRRQVHLPEHAAPAHALVSGTEYTTGGPVVLGSLEPVDGLDSSIHIIAPVHFFESSGCSFEDAHGVSC